MHYYHFLIFILSGDTIGVSKGTCIDITAALPYPYRDDCSEDNKLLTIFSKKEEKLQAQRFSQIRISECKKIPEKKFRNKKITVTINIEEWQ